MNVERTIPVRTELRGRTWLVFESVAVREHTTISALLAKLADAAVDGGRAGERMHSRFEPSGQGSRPSLTVEERARRVGERQAAFHADPSDARHGTPNGYHNLKCRCIRCRQAQHDQYQARKANR